MKAPIAKVSLSSNDSIKDIRDRETFAGFGFDVDVVTNEQFVPDPASEYCPMVGSCGHSFCARTIRHWASAKGVESKLPCPLRCKREKKSGRGEALALGNDQIENAITKRTDIEAYEVKQLVPNFTLLFAIQTIKHVESNGSIALNEIDRVDGELLFARCYVCDQAYSTNSFGRAPMVGACGHTFCSSCLKNKHKNLSNSRRYIPCLRPESECKEEKAFHVERLQLNVSLRDALRYWQALTGRQSNDEPSAVTTPPTSTAKCDQHVDPFSMTLAELAGSKDDDDDDDDSSLEEIRAQLMRDVHLVVWHDQKETENTIQDDNSSNGARDNDDDEADTHTAARITTTRSGRKVQATKRYGYTQKAADAAHGSSRRNDEYTVDGVCDHKIWWWQYNENETTTKEKLLKIKWKSDWRPIDFMLKKGLEKVRDYVQQNNLQCRLPSRCKDKQEVHAITKHKRDSDGQLILFAEWEDSWQPLEYILSENCNVVEKYIEDHDLRNDASWEDHCPPPEPLLAAAEPLSEPAATAPTAFAVEPTTVTTAPSPEVVVTWTFPSPMIRPPPHNPKSSQPTTTTSLISPCDSPLLFHEQQKTGSQKMVVQQEEPVIAPPSKKRPLSPQRSFST